MSARDRVKWFVVLATLGLGSCRLSALERLGPNSSTIGWRYLDALWFREKGKDTAYGSSRMRATVAPNPEDRVRVGVLEEHAGATGKQWRSSVWLAAFLASASLDRELTDFRFNISVGGFIDGPSAGVLMAAGFMAVITGAPVRSEVTITGALAPDGSLAPVDGIPSKLEAALRTGKRFLGIPAGQRMYKEASGKRVDVVALGKAKGLQVVELDDLDDAYALLTGRSLPLSPAAPLAAMSIARRTIDRLRAATRRLLAGATKDLERSRLGRAAKKNQEVHWVFQVRARAERDLKRGEIPAAYLQSLKAAALARAAVRAVELKGSLEIEDWPRIGAAVDAGIATLSAALRREAQRREGGPGGDELLDRFRSLTLARVLRRVVQAVLRSIPTKKDPPEGNARGARAHKSSQPFGPRAVRRLSLRGKSFLVALYLGLAESALENRLRGLEERPGSSVRLVLDSALVTRSARALASAASGNIEYVDTVLLKQLADERGSNVDSLRQTFARNEPAYLLAAHAAEMSLQAEDERPRTIEQSLSRLSEAALSYLESAIVMARYYSLDAEVPTLGPPRRVDRPIGLEAMLRRAESGARESSRRVLTRLGLVPLWARIRYHAARVGMKGDIAEKLTALAGFWRVTMMNRLALVALRRR